MRTWSMRSRRGACWTAWWATRSRRCCGTRCGAGSQRGRVQTVALRMIVEREREINAFVPVEYWKIEPTLKPANGSEFTARFTGIDGERARWRTASTRKARRCSFGALARRSGDRRGGGAAETAAWSVVSVERKERQSNPTAPYITSKLQQDASRRLGFNVRRTMGVAQRLYEGVEIGGRERSA